MKFSHEICQRRLQLILRLFFIISAAILVSGCGGEEPARKPDLKIQATIAGVLLKDGKPLSPETQILFFCPERDSLASGKTDAAGKFTLTAADARIGIPMGKYRVVVRPPAVKVETDIKSGSYEAKMKGIARPAPPVASSEIPVEFSSTDSTRLILEVKVGSNDFPIDLTNLGN